MTLRDQIKEMLRSEFERVIDELADHLMASVEQAQSVEETRRIVQKGVGDRTHLGRVIQVLEAADGEPMSAADIARAAGIDNSAVRMILYKNKERFQPDKFGGRVWWTLAQEPAMA